MDILYDIFPLVLYFLGAVLLVVVIMLLLKIMDTFDKINVLLDDVENKSQKLNGLFDAVEGVGSTISSVNTRLSSFVAGIVKNIIRSKKKNKKSSKEDE